MKPRSRPEISTFFGRAVELETLSSWLATPPSGLAWVSGAGGMGKTTLLRELRRRTQLDEGKLALVSADRVAPSPDGVIEAAQRALRLPPDRGDLRSFLTGGRVLVLDGFETVAGLEAWLLDELSGEPPLEGHVIVVSRDAPSHGWLSPHLAGRLLSLQLGPFDTAEAEAYLAAHGVDVDQRSHHIAFTRGHPLALAVLASSGAVLAAPTAPGDRPDVLRILLDATVERSLDAGQRATLEAAACVPAITEPLLAALLDEKDVHAQLTWLAARPYVVATPTGLRLHDLVRDVISAELRWRNPERAHLLGGRAFDCLSLQLGTGSPELRRQAAESLAAMAGQLPGGSWVFAAAQRDLYLDAVREEEVGAIADTFERIDGPESRALWLRSFRRRPGVTMVARNAAREVRGVWVDHLLSRGDLPAEREDPAFAAIDRFLTREQMPASALISVQRNHLDGASGRLPGATMSLSVGIEIRALVSVPRLQMRFFVTPADTPWAPHWEALGYVRPPDADFSVDGAVHSFWYLDFRVASAVAYLRTVFSRLAFAPPGGGGGSPDAPASIVPPLPPMAPPDDATVRGALRTTLQALNDATLLAESPLLALELVPSAVGTPAVRARALRALLLEQIQGLGATGRGLKQRRALEATYVDPPSSQEEAAERLGLPFRTFRDHLTGGLDELSRRVGRLFRELPFE